MAVKAPLLSISDHMIDFSQLAGQLGMGEDQTRRVAALLQQGLLPSFVLQHRPDEVGDVSLDQLWQIKTEVDRQGETDRFRESLLEELDANATLTEQQLDLLKRSGSRSRLMGLTRGLRYRKNSASLLEKHPELAPLAQRLLTLAGEGEQTIEAWLAEQPEIEGQTASALVGPLQRYLQWLLYEDLELVAKIYQQLIDQPFLSLELLADDAPESAEVASAVDSTEVESDAVTDPLELPATELPATATSDAQRQPETETGTEAEADVVADGVDPQTVTSGNTAEVETAEVETTEVETTEVDAEQIEVAEAGVLPSQSAEEEGSTETPAELLSEATADTDPAVEAPTASDAVSGDVADTQPQVETVSLADWPAGSKKSKKRRSSDEAPKPAGGKKDAKLTPRQRRRRWLKSSLQGLPRNRLALARLSPQHLVLLACGLRAQVCKAVWKYDRKSMVQSARRSLSPGRHPLHSWLLHVAESALSELILPKLEQDVLIEAESVAHDELIHAAGRHYEAQLTQRPCEDHRILLVDAVGTSTAAVVVVDAVGGVLHCDELPSISSRPEVVSQHVAQLGQWIHRFQVSLVVVSNGPARRFLMHSIKELMKQSGESGLRWSMVDRAGADTYANSPLALRELPKISRRHRSAGWLARRLQDPLQQLLKVEAVRLRSSNLQRELPEKRLTRGLQQRAADVLLRVGIDGWRADAARLGVLLGDSQSAHAYRETVAQATELTRERIAEALTPQADPSRLRQALAAIRIYDSPQPLDATPVHPEDYRWADKLLAVDGIDLPELPPLWWKRPDSTLTAVEPTEPVAVAVENKPSVDDQVAGEADSPSETPAALIDEPATDSSAPASEATESAPSTTPEAAPEGESPETPAGEAEAAGEVVAEAAGEVVAEAAALPGSAEDDPSTLPVEPATDEATFRVAPPYDPNPLPRAKLAVDTDTLAKSWQAGFRRLRNIALSLQDPLTDPRNHRYAVPLLTQVPSLEDLKPGDSAWAVIVGVASFGAFAEVGPDCSGLIHVSRLSSDFIQDPHEVVQVGDMVQVWVVDIDQKRRRVGLTALPPGTAEARPPRRGGGGEIPASGESSRSGGRGGNRGGDRSGTQPGERRGQAGGRGGPRGGGDRDGGRGPKRDGGRRGGGRHESSGSDSYTPRPSKPAPPPKPISEEMATGQEPLRSFSDLMQFFQQKAATPPATKAAAEPVSGESEVSQPQASTTNSPPQSTAPPTADETQSS